MSLLVIQESLERKQKALGDLVNEVEAAGKSWTDDQRALRKSLISDIADLAAEVEDARDTQAAKGMLAKFKKPAAPADMSTSAGGDRDMKSVRKHFNIRNSIKALVGGKLEGVEREMHEEAVKDAVSSGQVVEGIGVPHMLLHGQKVATNAQGGAGEGREFIAEDLRGPVLAIMPELVSEQLGVRKVTGLKGNLRTAKHTNRFTAFWENELEDTDPTQMTMTDYPNVPHRLAAYTDIARGWLNQTSLSSEASIVGKIRDGMREKLDYTFFNGAGVKDPLGILNLPDTTVISLGANGAALDYDGLLQIEEKVAEQNFSGEMYKFVTTPRVRRKLKQTKIDAGSGLMVWTGNDAADMRGYVSNHIPNDLTKGTSGATLNALIAGGWSKAEILGWGGIDITLDNVTQALSHSLRIVINSYWDFSFSHQEAFVVIKDIDVS